jgi:peptide/nickel transport system ATP-binding protein
VIAQVEPGTGQTTGVEPLEAGGRLLELRDLRIDSVGSAGRRSIVRGIDLVVGQGETVGVVGESGSGKSVTARAVMRLLPAGLIAGGSIRFGNEELLALDERRMRAIRGSQIAMLFQDPYTMLNPLLRSGRHIEETLLDGRGKRRPEPGGHAGTRALRAQLAAQPPRRRRTWKRTETLRRLSEVGISDPHVADRYPFQLSGGMRQRVALAASLARDPGLLIADEPTTALDVTTQAEILGLLRRVQEARGMGLVLITHDLRIAFAVCDRVHVMYAGTILEVSPARPLSAEPLHPYTLGLLLSEPPVDRRLAQLSTIEGAIRRPDEVVSGCAFAHRCRWALDACREQEPTLVEVEPGRWSACIRIGEIRPELRAQRAAAGLAEPAAKISADVQPLVRVEDLRKTYEAARGRRVEAVRGVSLEIGANESVGLVGESGSGKTTLGRCLVGLETPTSGSVVIDGIDASSYERLTTADRRRLRRTIQIVFQDPYSSLNPAQRVGACLGEALALFGADARTISRQVPALLEQVGLPPAYASRRPAALSGGERQRVAVARALAVGPRILVCDEPVSSLDVSVQAQMLRLFRSLQADLGLSYLFITHDLAVVRQVVDRVYVMYQGAIVESGPVERVLDRPEHAYTKRLVASVPGQA